MSRWLKRLLALALVAVLAVFSYAGLDLYLRQLAFDNCMRQLESLELRRVQQEPSRVGGDGYRTYEGLDDTGQRRYAAIYHECELCRYRVENWPR